MKSAPVILSMLTALCLGIALPAGPAPAQEEKPAGDRFARTWLSFAGHVARPQGCGAADLASGSRGIFSFTSAHGRSSARFVELSPATISAEHRLGEVRAYLAADIVRADGSRDPAFGPTARDMVLHVDADGRVSIRFVDFSSDEFGFDFMAYPPPSMR